MFKKKATLSPQPTMEITQKKFPYLWPTTSCGSLPKGVCCHKNKPVCVAGSKHHGVYSPGMTLNQHWIKNLAPLPLRGTILRHVPHCPSEAPQQDWSPVALSGNLPSHTFYCLLLSLQRVFSDYLTNKLLTTKPLLPVCFWVTQTETVTLQIKSSVTKICQMNAEMPFQNHSLVTIARNYSQDPSLLNN